MQPEIKRCQNCHQDFIIEPEDFAFYEKIKVPAPTWCPDCREQRRLAFRNGHSLYKRKCDLCGVDVVSRISPDKPYPMFCKKCWWSDKWDPMQYGRAYDFSKPFFEQFKELLLAAPHISIFNSNTVNSDWVNQETDDKNCYLNIGGHFNEDSAYNTFEVHGKNCFDNFWVWQCELCYQDINCERCYKTLFSQDCLDCLEVVLCFDCRACQNCFGCAGLRHKQYHIFNKPCSKEDYQRFISQNPLSSFKGLAALKEKAKNIWLSVPHRATQIVKCYNASGCYITESKNVSNAWWTDKTEDSKHLFITAGLKDCYDATCFGWGELCYEICGANGLSCSNFSAYVIGTGRADKIACFNLEYCFATPSCSNCFGCCNLKGKEYCIFNKQYSKEEYEKLVPKIIKHMNEMPYISKRQKSKLSPPTNPSDVQCFNYGQKAKPPYGFGSGTTTALPGIGGGQENQNYNSKVKSEETLETEEIIYRYGEFFPPELSPFGYNETTAQDYYPLTKDQAKEQGYNWSDYESEIKYQFSDYKIPDDIRDVKDDILEKILKCEVSCKAYKIIPMELGFYRKMGLPLPRRAPLERHKDRMVLLPPRKLFQRKCQKCQKEIQSVYAPARPEIVYCESCYLAEVV